VPCSDAPIWHKQPREGSAQYLAFARYRDAGPDRSIARVAATTVTAQSPSSHHQRRYLTHPQPEVYLRSVVRCLKRWSKRFHWMERVQAYDAHQAAVQQKIADDQAAAERQRQAAEEQQQRQLRRQEAQAARAVGRRGLLRILHEIERQQLEQMQLPQLIPHLKKFLDAVTEGQRLERSEDRESAEVVEPIDKTIERVLRAAFEIIRDMIEPARWDEASARVIAAVDPGSGGRSGK
jgi:hypothetical protein